MLKTKLGKRIMVSLELVAPILRIYAAAMLTAAKAIETEGFQAVCLTAVEAGEEVWEGVQEIEAAVAAEIIIPLAELPRLDAEACERWGIPPTTTPPEEEVNDLDV